MRNKVDFDFWLEQKSNKEFFNFNKEMFVTLMSMSETVEIRNIKIIESLRDNPYSKKIQKKNLEKMMRLKMMRLKMLILYPSMS